MNLIRTVAAFACLAIAVPAAAEVAVDQSFSLYDPNLWIPVSTPTGGRVAQSFTAGIEGYLNTIRVTLDESVFLGPRYLDGINILDSLDGDGKIVGTSTLFSALGPDAHYYSQITFDVRHLNIAVRSGERWAFELFGREVVPFPGGEARPYLTAGTGYEGGSVYMLNPVYGWTVFTAQPYDVFFETTVDAVPLPVPEPAGYAMLAAGLGVVTGVARRRRARSDWKRALL